MQDTNIFPLPKHQPDGWVKRSLGQKNGFISGAPAGWDFFSSPTGRKAQYSFFFNLFRLTKMLFSSSVIFAHLLPLITNFSLTQVIFAFTRTLDVRFEFVIRKNDIFWGSVGIEHHFLNQKKYFCAHPVEFFFFTRCAGNKPIFSFGLTRPRKSVPPPLSDRSQQTQNENSLRRCRCKHTSNFGAKFSGADFKTYHDSLKYTFSWTPGVPTVCIS